MRLAYAILTPPDESYNLLQLKSTPQPHVDFGFPLAFTEQKLVISIRVNMEVLAIFLKAEPFWVTEIGWSSRRGLRRCGHKFLFLRSSRHRRAPFMPMFWNNVKLRNLLDLRDQTHFYCVGGSRCCGIVVPYLRD